MKAIRQHAHGGPDSLRYEGAPGPSRRAGEVLDRVRAAGVIPTELLWQTSRTCLLLTVLTTLDVGGAILAQHVQHTGNGQAKVTQLSQRDIIEKLDGKAASETVVEVTFEPGRKDSPHHHTGPVFGYVLEGEYEHALDDEPVKKYEAGDTFYEPSGSVHRVARNPSGKTRTRLLAVILHSRDNKETTVREKGMD
jgi:quercetin dioxygenase-like cupin family protein